MSLDDDILKLGREYARTHNVSFNVLVRRLIEQTVTKKRSDWLDDTFAYIDQNIESRAGVTWKREDLQDGQKIRGMKIVNPFKSRELGID